MTARCRHFGLKQHQFSDGSMIQLCDSCTTFDNARQSILAGNSGTVARVVRTKADSDLNTRVLEQQLARREQGEYGELEDSEEDAIEDQESQDREAELSVPTFQCISDTNDPEKNTEDCGHHHTTKEVDDAVAETTAEGEVMDEIEQEPTYE
jgi:hypothetical protein